MIVGGGPGCISDAPAEKLAIEKRMENDVLSLMPEIIAKDVPFLGCCYGIGIVAHHLGAEVSKARYSEPVGGVTCRITTEGMDDPLLRGFPETFAPWSATRRLCRNCRKAASTSCHPTPALIR